MTQDAQLVMKLTKHNNYEILDLMNAISNITQLPFDRVCHTSVSTWWTNIINRRIWRIKTTNSSRKVILADTSIEPIKGYYQQPVYVLDVKSLYPTMMINHNISFDTVNCDCCKNDLNAKVSAEIMNIINDGLTEEKKRDQYWICKKKIGIIPNLLTKFRDERFRQQELGNTSMQLALKNLINGIYGLFGTDFFEFADYRVAELTTAFGRKVLQYMEKLLKKFTTSK